MEINLIKSNFEIDYARPLNPHFMSIKGHLFFVLSHLEFAYDENSKS